jgi:hypothetical protein
MERSAKFSHQVVDISLLINEQIGAPQLRNNFSPGNELVAAADQKDQQLHRLFFELHTPSKTPKFIATKVEFDIASRRLRGAHQGSVSALCARIQ